MGVLGFCVNAWRLAAFRDLGEVAYLWSRVEQGMLAPCLRGIVASAVICPVLCV